MTCGQKHCKNAPTEATRVDHTEVEGRPPCIHPGCGRPIQGDGKCVFHHSQDPATLARQIVGEIRCDDVGAPDNLYLALQYAADALQVAEQAGDPALLAEIEAALPPELHQARERGPVRLADIPRREYVKRALEVAIAGGHSVCLTGHPELTAPFATWAKAQGLLSVYEAAPCRCGNYGDPAQECTCSWAEVARWRQRQSYRRARTAALTVEVRRLSRSEERDARRGESGGHVLTRALMAQYATDKSLVPDEGSMHLLRAANRQLALGWARSRQVLELARTIARLADQRLSCTHVAEAIQYCPRRFEQPVAKVGDVPLVFRDMQGQPRPVRLEDIPGQEHIKAALETALLGGHTVGVVVGDGAAGDLLPLAEWGRAQGLDVQMVTPCPCGCFGSPTEECTCSAKMVARHRARPEYQAVQQQDLVLTVAEQVPWDKFESDLRGEPIRREPEAAVLKRVAAAQEQAAQSPAPAPALPPAQQQWLLERELDATARNRVLRIAETRARQDGETEIAQRHLAAALEWAGVASPGL